MSQSFEMNIYNLSYLARIVREKGIWFREIEYEYRKHSKILLVRFKNSRCMKLSENYLSTVENQLKLLEKEIIIPFIEKIKSNFILSVTVNAQGKFSLYDIKLKFKINCNKTTGNAIDYFREPFKVLLPFALYISEVEFRGNKYNLSVVEADAIISFDELKETIHNPIIAPKALQNWSHIYSVVIKESKKQYFYTNNIPCIEGELHWEDNQIMQYTFYDVHESKRKETVFE